MARINLVHVDVERLFAAQGVLAKFKRSQGWLLVQRLGLRITGCEPTHAGQRRSEALAQKMLIRNRPVTTMTAKVTPARLVRSLREPGRDPLRGCYRRISRTGPCFGKGKETCEG